MPYATIAGDHLFYQESGAGEALVLLHGDYECTRYWWSQVAAFSPRYRVIRHDRRGFGRSAPLAAFPADFYDRDAADLIALLDHLGVDAAHLAGHSGGGTVALLTAARYPERVRSVVTAGAHSYVESLTLDYVRSFAKRLDESALRRAGEACHGARWREVGAMFAARWLDPAWHDWSILPELSRITCPAFLMLADDDGTASREQFSAMTAAIPNVRTWQPADGGHVIHRRMPEQFNERVLAFLASLPHS